MDAAVYFECTHPNDIKRHSLGRSKLFKIGSDMYHEKSENCYISTYLKTKASTNEYRVLLYQIALIYSEIPYKTLHSIKVNTDITGLITNHQGYHYYVGNDKSFFSYPNQRLLLTGNVFSNREFEIIKNIAKGLESHEIAEKLFLSVHTVNTHRRNILIKTGKRTTHEPVHELQERGVI